MRFEALHDKKALRKAARLTAKQLDKVKEAIADDPTKSGYLRWDGKALSDYIGKTFQVTLVDGTGIVASRTETIFSASVIRGRNRNMRSANITRWKQNLF